MCTIHSFSQSFWQDNKDEVLRTLKSDARMNSDGITAIILAADKDDDLTLSAMDIKQILPTIEMAMDEADEGTRLFVHQRMATTSYVGLPFNHGFSDFKGMFLMHNGIVSNPNNYCVDSFGLIKLKPGHEDALIELMLMRETYVNMFRIYPQQDKWEMLRLSTGSLYTDGNGNYSSTRCGPIDEAVEKFTSQSFAMPERAKNRLTTPRYVWPSYNSGYYGGSRASTTRTPSRNYFDWDAYGFDDEVETNAIHAIESAETKRIKADEKYILDDTEELIAENLNFFVTLCKETNRMFAYLQADGSFYYKENAYLTEGLLADPYTLRTQAEYMMEECDREFVPTETKKSI